MRDTAAAKRLLFRRLKALHAYESANRALEKARAKNKDVHAVSKLLYINLYKTKLVEKDVTSFEIGYQIYY